MHTSSSPSPSTVRFSPNSPEPKSSHPKCSCQYRYDRSWYTNTARCSPPCPAVSPCPSPSRLSLRTRRGPVTGSLKTPVKTVRPCHGTSLGIPTLTDSSVSTQRVSREHGRPARGGPSVIRSRAVVFGGGTFEGRSQP